MRQTIPFALLVVLAAGAAPARPFNDVKDGSWTNRATWDEKVKYYPAQGGDVATLDSHSVYLDGNVAPHVRVVLAGGTLLKGGPGHCGFSIKGPIVVTRPSVVGNPQRYNRGRRPLNLTGRISGPHRLTKTGRGIVVLSYGNTSFTGGWDVKDGILNAAGDGGLGRGAVTVHPGAALWVRKSNVVQSAGRAPKQIIIKDATLCINGGYGHASVAGWKIILDGGTLLMQPSGSNGRSVHVRSGEVQVKRDATLRGHYAQASDSTFAAALTGAGALTLYGFTGPGRLKLSGDGSKFSGPVCIAGGRITVTRPAGLGSGDITVKAGATLELTASGITHHNARLHLAAGRTGENGVVELGPRTVNTVGAVRLVGADGLGVWLRAGEYTAADLPGHLVGPGALRVLTESQPVPEPIGLGWGLLLALLVRRRRR